MKAATPFAARQAGAAVEPPARPKPAADRPCGGSRRSRRQGLGAPRPGLWAAFLLLTALSLTTAGCGPRPAVLSDPTAPPTGYARRIVLVVETGDFYPIAGAEIAVETEEPTRLLSPPGGRGRTDAQGRLELVFEPYPHYDQKVMAGGDIVADFPVRATLTISRAGRPPFQEKLNDTQTFARYADPLYQGLDRDPVSEPTYHHIAVP